MTKALFVVLVVLLGLSVLACAHSEKETNLPARGTREFGDPSQTVRVAVGETFSVVLAANATTGYVWQPGENTGDRIVIFTGGTYVAPRTDLAGAGGRQRLTFKATSPGTERMTFHYRRPWEKDVEPARTVVFTVTVR